ncbi:hypothetical protein, partial [uncultured Christiangramia sp.]|uniref:hypothetical protein n=1 Tax=Christiangramia sp. 3-2217-3z TaxID=3417564 RepID=UPI0026197644
ALSFNTKLRQAQPRFKRMPLQSLTQTNKREVESYNCSFELLNLRWIILFLLVNKQNFQVATAEILKNTGVSLRAGLSALSFNTKLRQAQPRFKRMPLQSLTQKIFESSNSLFEPWFDHF